MSASTRLPRSVLTERRAELVDVLKRFHVTHAGVSGSTARRGNTGRSDLDIIVEFEGGAPRDLIRLSAALSDWNWHGNSQGRGAAVGVQTAERVVGLAVSGRALVAASLRSPGVLC